MNYLKISTFLLFSFFLFYLSTLVQFNPDHLAYYLLYYYSSENAYELSCSFIHCNIFYGYLNYIFGQFIDFEYFRYLILLFSLIYLFFFNKIHFSKSNFLYICIILFTFLFFFLEYFVIRLRAGISILFFWIALNFLINQKYYLLSSFFIFISFSIHLLTASFLLVFLIIYLINQWRPLFSYFFTLIIFMIFFSLTDIIAIKRGADLFSQLNFYRVLGNYLLPLTISIFFISRQIFINKFNKQILNSEIFLIIILFLLVLFYFLGYIEISGEAIVRFTSVLSAFCVWFLINQRTPVSYLSIYYTLPLCNSLFFFNTIYGDSFFSHF